MSPDFYRSQILASQKKISSLQKDKAREAGRISDLQRRISSAVQAAARTTSQSTLNSKRSEVDRLEREVASTHRKIGDLDGKIADEMGRVASAQSNLAKEESRIAEKRLKEDQKRAREATNQMSRISRQLHAHHNAIQDLSRVPEEISILFVAANPLDQEPIRLDEEVREIEELIRKADFRDSIKLLSTWAARPLDLIQKLNEIKPTILHISGHGSDQDELVFQDDNGETKLVSKDAFIQTIAATIGSLKVIFLNSCHSAPHAEAATQFVSAAVGMRAEIGDEAARVFASRFYAAIGFGMDLERAFLQGKAALMLEGIPEESTPVIFSKPDLPASEIVLVQPSPVRSLRNAGPLGQV